MSTATKGLASVSLDRGRDRTLLITFSGPLTTASTGAVWLELSRALQPKKVQSLSVQAETLEACDGAGVAVLVNLKRWAAEHAVPIAWEGLSGEIEQQVALYVPERLNQARKRPARKPFATGVGESTVAVLTVMRDQIAFLGELVVAFLRLLRYPRSLRMADFWGVAESAGVRGVPIIAMLGFLVGLIMAFQGAVSMGQFGAEIYVADFVGLSVLRELGPLITGIILAGRTGSAFAAELGTMKVNEEIDALTTMGLDPMRFLVIPRVWAASLMTPLLAMFANLCGLAGGALVMSGLGFPLVTYVNRVIAAVSVGDLLGGLAKALVFGFLVATTGCLSGLRTGEGASAVGDSATRAVVSAIIMIVVTDGLFAVLFFYLGI